MGREKRKDHRQPLKYPAKIDIGDMVALPIDVSASGARVTVEDPGKSRIDSRSCSRPSTARSAAAR